jgi:hypothetical protein
MWERMSFDWWMSAKWAMRDEQPILPTSTNICITGAAGTQGVNIKRTEDIRQSLRWNNTRQYIHDYSSGYVEITHTSLYTIAMCTIIIIPLYQSQQHLLNSQHNRKLLIINGKTFQHMPPQIFYINAQTPHKILRSPFMEPQQRPGSWGNYKGDLGDRNHFSLLLPA